MRSGLVIQLQIKALSREAEVQIEWTIYSGIKHTIWGSDTYKQQTRGVQS